MAQRPRVVVSVTDHIASASHILWFLRNNAEHIQREKCSSQKVENMDGRFHDTCEVLCSILEHLEPIEQSDVIKLTPQNILGLQRLFINVDLNIADELHQQIIELKPIAEQFLEWVYHSVYRPWSCDTSNPYATVSDALSNLSRDLETTRNALLAEPQSATIDHAAGSIRLCPGAVSILNDQDEGEISQESVPRKYLNKSHRYRKALGGNFKWWRCKFCEFRTIVHVCSRSGAGSKILNSDWIIPSSSISGMSYRKTLWAKSHLRTVGLKKSGGSSILGCIVCVAQGKDLRQKENIFWDKKDLLKHLKGHNDEGVPAEFIQKLLGITVGEIVPKEPTFDVYFKT